MGIKNLRVYTNGDEMAVAESPSDAFKLVCEYLGPHWRCKDGNCEYTANRFRAVPRGRKIYISVDESGQISSSPRPGDPEVEPMVLTADEWAAREGRGFLCGIWF